MHLWRKFWFRGYAPRRQRRTAGGTVSMSRGGQMLLSAVLGIGLAIAVIVLFDRSIRPVVTALAKNKAENAVTRIINDAVAHTLSAEAVAYGDMVTLQKDAAGQITALTSNSAEMNRLRTEIVGEIMEQVNSLDSVELGVPLGNITGFSVLSEQGPLLPVRVLSVASAEADFSNRFAATGINQTQHRIMLDVIVTLKLLIPGGTVETAVHTQVNVAETVIVGAVPDAYLQFGRDAGSVAK